MVLTAIMASAVGGYMAGRLRRRWIGVGEDETYFRDTAHGFLAWALVQSGFLHVELLEPSDYFNTGTGYLKTRPDAAGMVIHRDLADWHAASALFDVVAPERGDDLSPVDTRRFGF